MKYHRENYVIDKICPLWADYQVVQLIKPASTILEIGCATGYIGKFLKEKRNCKMFGIEIDKESAELAKPYYEKIVVGDVENEETLIQLSDAKVPFGTEALATFDYILCMNVLEHLINPKKVLVNLKKFLKPNGSLIACMPNIAHWSIRLKLLFGNFDYEKGVFETDHGKGIMDETHLKFFTLKTMKRLITDSGYKIEYISFDPDKGIPKFHGLFLRIPCGWKFLKKFYSIWPTLFGFQFIFKAKPI